MPVSLVKKPVDPQNLAAIQRLAPFLIAVFAFVLYVGTFRFEFVYDDVLQVVNNPLIRSWNNLGLLFKTDVWRFSNPMLVGNYWRPMFMVWLLINHSLFGLNPAGWHITSALLHTAATYFSFRLAYRLSGSGMVSTITALIFAVHPCHIETVAWVSGATDSLMALFYITSLLAFIRGWNQRSAKRWAWIALSGFLFLLSVLSKETALTLPVMVLGFAASLGKRNEDSWATVAKRLAGPLLMFAVVFVLYWIGRNNALSGVSHSQFQIGILSLLMTWPSLTLFYVRHLVWPVGLSVYYGSTIVMQPTWVGFWLPLIAIVLLLALVAAAIVRTKSKLLALAFLLVVVPLAPAFVFPAVFPIDFAHDRYLYLSCLGFAILVGMAIRHVAERFQSNLIRIGATAILVLVLSTASLAEMVYWANDVVLFARATQIAPGYIPGYSALGGALAARGRKEEAMFVLRNVIKADPHNHLALSNLGLSSFLDGDYGLAEQYLVQAVAIKPWDADSLALLAESRIRLGKFAEAEADIRQALEVKPYKPGYRRVLALSLEGQGRIDAALEQAETEARQNPKDAEAPRILERLKAEAEESQSAKKSRLR